MVVSPLDVRSFFAYRPLRLLPEFRPLASYGSYPRCSLSSVSNNSSIVCANRRAKMPSFPKKSSIDFALANSRWTSSVLGMTSWMFRGLPFSADIVFSPYSLRYCLSLVYTQYLTPSPFLLLGLLLALGWQARLLH